VAARSLRRKANSLRATALPFAIETGLADKPASVLDNSAMSSLSEPERVKKLTMRAAYGSYSSLSK
jgi:hypothetical protein